MLRCARHGGSGYRSWEKIDAIYEHSLIRQYEAPALQSIYRDKMSAVLRGYLVET